MKAIGIIRVSTEKQKDKYGPVTQRADIERKAGELGWELVGVWSFQESAANPDNRPQFTAMLNDLVTLGQGGSIQGVIMGHPDRLGRDGPMAFFHYCYILRQLGKLEIRFALDDRDPSDRHYEDDLFDAAVGARKEWTKITRRLRSGRMDRAREGKLSTGDKQRTLFGYRYNKDTGARVKDEGTNPILRAIGDQVLSGVPLRRVSEWAWTEHGVKLPTTTLRKLLQNPAIAGRFVSRWREPDGTITEIRNRTFVRLRSPGRNSRRCRDDWRRTGATLNTWGSSESTSTR
jgi:DNA invertase Pin-like site-specific DNA recombinase